MTSPLSPPNRGRSSVLGTSTLSRVAETPWTLTGPDARAQNSQEYGLLSARPGEVGKKKWVSGQPAKYSETNCAGKPAKHLLSLRGQYIQNWRNLRRKRLASGFGVQ